MFRSKYFCRSVFAVLLLLAGCSHNGENNQPPTNNQPKPERPVPSPRDCKESKSCKDSLRNITYAQMNKVLIYFYQNQPTNYSSSSKIVMNTIRLQELLEEQAGLSADKYEDVTFIRLFRMLVTNDGNVKTKIDPVLIVDSL